jgi:GTPase SAR1 family protein
VAAISCHEGHDTITDCPFYTNNDEKKIVRKVSKKMSIKSSLPWTGEALAIDELDKVTYRNSPVIIGIVGKADAGKTTYLAMLFTLFLRGAKLKDFSFSGTKTIHAWDRLYKTLQVQQDGVEFPDPTPSQYIRFLHLALRNNKNRLKDVLLSDIAGEVFSLWATNRNDTNAENARWIYKYANAFVLFIDCEDLIKRKAQAKNDIIDMAQMLKHDLRGRPVVVVWSKSDKKSEVHTIILEKLQEELSEIFIDLVEKDISNFSNDDPDILVHTNNVAVLDSLLAKIFVPVGLDIPIKDIHDKKDAFLNFKNL